MVEVQVKAVDKEAEQAQAVEAAVSINVYARSAATKNHTKEGSPVQKKPAQSADP
jgi:hypothetical protein